MPYKDPEKARAYSRLASARWRAKHAKEWKERFRDKLNQAARKSTTKWRDLAIAAFGGCCVKCGFGDSRALQFDHINGGGIRDAGRKMGRARYYRQIIDLQGTGKFQLLCANCNWIKRHELNEHNNMIWQVAR